MAPSFPAISELKAPRCHCECLIFPAVELQYEILTHGYQPQALDGITALPTLENMTSADLSLIDWRMRRRFARGEIAALAINYEKYWRERLLPEQHILNQHGKTAESLIHIPWIITGHQPEFIHPGVWLKNHFACALARRSQGLSLNLIVDYDILKHAEFKYPECENSNGYSEYKFAFTDSHPSQLWESAAPPGESERQNLKSLIRKLQQSYPEKMLFTSLLEESPDVINLDVENLGEWITLLRKKGEYILDIDNLDLPVSHLCETSSFLLFFIELAKNGDSFSEVYNEVLESYRQLNGINNKAQPLPDLKRENTSGGTRFELPFWIISEKKKLREPAFCLIRHHELHITTPSGISLKIPGNQAPADIITSLKQGLNKYGASLRSRVLTLTMFARLYLADLFIHGLGGGKYDLMTNELVQRFYGITASAYSVVTGTCWLPFHCDQIPVKSMLISELELLKNQLRNIRFQPEYFFDHSSSNEIVQEVVRLKQTMRERNLGPRIHLSKSSRDSQKLYYKKTWLRLCELRRQLTSLLAEKQSSTKSQINNVQNQLEQLQILTNREYPAFLYSAKTLNNFFQQAR